MTEADVVYAIHHGRAFPADNMVEPANGAIRYVHPVSGRSVVIDAVYREILHVGASNFRY